MQPCHRFCFQRYQSNFISTALNIVSHIQTAYALFDFFNQFFVRREFAIWAKAVVQVLETLPDILERDCGLQPAAVSRVQSIIDDLRDQIALRVTEAGADDEEELQQEE